MLLKLVKTRLALPPLFSIHFHPQLPQFLIQLVWGLRLCIYNTFPDEVAAASWESTRYIVEIQDIYILFQVYVLWAIDPETVV